MSKTEETALWAAVNLAIFVAAVSMGWLTADSLIRARDRWMTGVD